MAIRKLGWIVISLKISVAPIIGSAIGSTLYQLVYYISGIRSVSVANY